MSLNLTPRRASLDFELPGASDPQRRYLIKIGLCYKIFHGSRLTERGIGETQEFSAGNVRFRSGRALAQGVEMELALEWPLRIDGLWPLELVIWGSVLGSNEEGSTLKIVRYEFRARSNPATAPGGRLRRGDHPLHGTSDIDPRRD